MCLSIFSVIFLFFIHRPFTSSSLFFHFPNNTVSTFQPSTLWSLQFRSSLVNSNLTLAFLARVNRRDTWTVKRAKNWFPLYSRISWLSIRGWSDKSELRGAHGTSIFAQMASRLKRSTATRWCYRSTPFPWLALSLSLSFSLRVNLAYARFSFDTVESLLGQFCCFSSLSYAYIKRMMVSNNGFECSSHFWSTKRILA